LPTGQQLRGDVGVKGEPVLVVAGIYPTDMSSGERARPAREIGRTFVPLGRTWIEGLAWSST
jgi:hypothetical protein